ncbi:MAG TPA: D-aminoacyl-tRNA deacylase [Bacteroidota bacterium]|nr:D-aminoacyl-tRNA deacylase [Bacteroidota bacterium]
MKALIQRVSKASVAVNGKRVGAIEKGLLVFLGIKNGDSAEDARYLSAKICSLRIFEDDQAKMNLSVNDVGGSLLVVSQFTLYGDTRKGNRPSFVEAAPPEVAEPFYNTFVGFLRDELGAARVATGVFRAMMEVELTNDGPVTVMVESKV